MMAVANGDSVGSGRFVDHLPEQGRRCFAAWLASRPTIGLPALHAFAPHRLPPAVVPWLLVHRLRPDGELVYGLAGDELTRWFGETPKGRPVLEYADPAERDLRLSVIRQAIDTGLPVWFRGELLFEGRENIAIGRLGLPAIDGPDRLLLLIYFVLGNHPEPRLRLVGRASFDPRNLTWCRQDDLAAGD